jgi:predicted nucleic acid-binding protein
MLVVADSSPVNFLVRIGCVQVLPALFGSVAIPGQVLAELSNARTPEEVRAFVARPPAWFRVMTVSALERIPMLDPGEEAAISLAREVKADAILIDDNDGRRVATRRGIVVIGTLGVLERASERDLVRLPEVAPRLLGLGFHIDPQLMDEAIARDARRRVGR